MREGKRNFIANDNSFQELIDKEFLQSILVRSFLESFLLEMQLLKVAEVSHPTYDEKRELVSPSVVAPLKSLPFIRHNCYVCTLTYVCTYVRFYKHLPCIREK